MMILRLPHPTHRAVFSYWCRIYLFVWAHLPTPKIFKVPHAFGTDKVFFVSCVLARVASLCNFTHVGDVRKWVGVSVGWSERKMYTGSSTLYIRPVLLFLNNGIVCMLAKQINNSIVRRAERKSGC
jgi:hypothetical protein